MDYKKYNNTKLIISTTKSIIAFILLLFFVYSGYSAKLVEILTTYSTNNYYLLLIYAFILGLTASILSFPLNYYSGFYLEHKYNLSNQNFWQWIWEKTKASLVGLVIGVPLLLAFYFTLNQFGNLWWLPFSIIIFILSVVLAQILPTLILPLFYKISPIENEELITKIKRIASDAKLNVENVFRFDMSKTTKKANAAFTGLGRTKKILLGDTLINNFNEDEIETVIAHELGHYKHKHIIINILVGTITSFLTLFIISVLYNLSISWFGYNNITDVGALPILSLWATLIGLIQTPLTNMLSRRHEYQADEYAVRVTNKKEIFINTLRKLTEQNLSDKNPHPFVEWFFYSHPSTEKRIEYLNKIF